MSVISISYVLYFDTAFSAEELAQSVLSRLNLRRCAGRSDPDSDAIWLSGDHSAVTVRQLDKFDSGSSNYRQLTSLKMIIDANKERLGEGLSLRLAGDIIQLCPGDVILENDTGPPILLRRGEKVWVSPDPYDHEHLLSGLFQPIEMIVGLPPPDNRVDAEA